MSRVTKGVVACLALLALLAALAAPLPARADGNADEAELQFQLGADAYRQSDFREALAHFLASNRLVPNRNVRFNIARVYERLAQYADAYRWYLDALEGETSDATVAAIRDALARIAPNVAVLDVTSDPPGATIYVDRRDLGSVAVAPRQVALAAGTFRVIGALSGYEDATVEDIVATTGHVTPVALHLVRIVGHVHVDADAGTTVHPDDEQAGAACTAPCTFDAPPGIHLLYFRREGFRVLPRQVNVVAGQTAAVRVTSTAVTGSLVVAADEREALVEVDGRAVGFTPAVVANVAVGRRTVRVSQHGFQTVEVAADVRENQQTDLGTVHLPSVNEVSSVSRVAEPIDDAPSSLSIITAQELEAFQYPTIAEALRGLRGVSLGFDSTYDAIGIRGLGQPNDYGNRLLILQDGAVLNDDILYQSYTGYDGRSDLGDVDRIEFVRGPGSVLYGTGAVSGVVNLVTRPRDEPDGVWAGIGTAGNGIARGRVGFRHALGRDAGIWSSVSTAHSDGYDVALPVPGAPTTVHGFDGFDSLTLNGRAWWKSLTATWFLTGRDQHIPTGAYGTVLGDGMHNRWRDSRGMLELRFEPELSHEVQLQARAAANFYRFSGDYTYPSDPDPAYLQHEEYMGVWSVADVRFVLRPTQQLRVSIGGEMDANFTASLDGTTYDPAAATRVYLHENIPYAILAGYGLVEWAPVTQLRFSLGARVDWWTPFRTAHDAAMNPIDLSVVAPSPRAAVIWKPLPTDVFKLMGGQAFRAPSPYELYYTDGGITQLAAVALGHSLRPETVVSGELEYSHHFDAEWTGLAGVYGQGAVNQVETVAADPTTPDVSTYANSQTAIFTGGVDVEVRRDFRGGWMFAGTAGYLRARRGDFLSGDRVQNVPEWFGSVRGVIPLGDSGARVATRLTLEAPRLLSAPDAAGHLETDPALVADVIVSGRFRVLGGVRWSVGVYNLFDWRYTIPVGGFFASPTMPQLGRTFMANLDLTF